MPPRGRFRRPLRRRHPSHKNTWRGGTRSWRRSRGATPHPQPRFDPGLAFWWGRVCLFGCLCACVSVTLPQAHFRAPWRAPPVLFGRGAAAREAHFSRCLLVMPCFPPACGRRSIFSPQRAVAWPLATAAAAVAAPWTRTSRGWGRELARAFRGEVQGHTRSPGPTRAWPFAHLLLGVFQERLSCV